MVTTDEKEKYRAQFKHIKVIPLDMDKLNKDLDESVKKELDKTNGIDSTLVPKYEKGDVFGMRSKWAVILGSGIIMDMECCGQHLKDGKKATLSIYKENKSEDGKTTSFSLMPIFDANEELAELVKDYGMAEVDLPTFMADRFCYNDRIVTNVYNIERIVKKK